METIPPKTTSKCLRSEIAGNVFRNHVTDRMADISVVGTLLNHAGDALSFHKDRSWHGNVISPYPETIPNDGMRKFTYVANGPDGAEGGVVYRMGNVFDWMVAWYVPPAAAENHEYTLIGPPGSYDKDDILDKIKGDMEKESKGSDNYMGYNVTASIDRGTTPVALTASIKKDSLEAASTA